jgi:hypothetical protein
VGRRSYGCTQPFPCAPSQSIIGRLRVRRDRSKWLEACRKRSGL